MREQEELRQQIFEIIDNQIKSNDPPETKQTLDRLIKLGYSTKEAKMLIGQCLANEIYDILKYKTPFNLDRYVKNLNKLPEEPFD
jgi:predicted Zn-dependent peptidase